jgi:hypothetical protein
MSLADEALAPVLAIQILLGELIASEGERMKFNFQGLIGVLGAVIFLGVTVHATDASVSWVKCADEHGTCAIKSATTVRYGKGRRWATKTFTNSFTCSNATFGGDPAYRIVKECDVAVPGADGSGVASLPPSTAPTPAPSRAPASIPPAPSVPSVGLNGILNSSLTTSGALSFCANKVYPKQWEWASGYAQSARSAVASDNLTPKIEQHRMINGVDTVVAVYRSFASSSSCTEIWLPATNTTGYTPAQLQTMANTGCGPFGNTPHIDLFRLWKNGDTFRVYPAVYTGLYNNIVIQPQHDIYISGQPAPLYIPDQITIQGVEQNGIRPVLYRNDAGPGDYATNMGPIYLLQSTNLTISNLDVTLGPNGNIYKGLIYDNGAGNGGTDANGKLIAGTTTLRNMRISGGRMISGGVNGIFSTGSTAGTLALENIELFNNGGNNGPAHNAYLGTSSVDPNFTVKMMGSWTHDAIYGHTFKTRAQKNVMIGNYFQGSVPHDGFAQAEAYLLDVPNGGILIAKNNIFAKNFSGGGSNAMSIAYAAEGIVDTRPLSIDIQNNSFVAFSATLDGSHPLYPLYFRGGLPGDATFPFPNTVVSKNAYVGYCPTNNARMDYRGDLSLSVGFSEFNQDFTLLNRYSSSDQSMVGTQAYKHATQGGLLRKLPTIGAED